METKLEEARCMARGWRQCVLDIEQLVMELESSNTSKFVAFACQQILKRCAEGPAEKPKDCTWKDCTNVGIHELINANGEPWALLCAEHKTEFDDNVNSSEVRRVCRDWVLANGGV